MLSRLFGCGTPVEIFVVDHCEDLQEHLAVVAGEADVIGIAGAGHIGDRAGAAERPIGAVEAQRLEGTEVERVPGLIDEVLGLGPEPVLFRELVSELSEPAVNVACALPL